MTADLIRGLIRDVPDFPKAGVMFKDITPVLADAGAFDSALDLIIGPFRDTGVTKVAGIEARGFMFAAPIACRLDAGFIPIRKPGKLPREVVEQEYALEYGTDRLQVHADAIGAGDRVLVIDDVLATGGRRRRRSTCSTNSGQTWSGYRCSSNWSSSGAGQARPCRLPCRGQRWRSLSPPPRRRRRRSPPRRTRISPG